MSDRDRPPVLAPGETRVWIYKPAAVGKTELVTYVQRPSPAHAPMQHQAGWQPPIITR